MKKVTQTIVREYLIAAKCWLREHGFNGKMTIRKDEITKKLFLDVEDWVTDDLYAVLYWDENGYKVDGQYVPFADLPRTIKDKFSNAWKFRGIIS